jgi:hypothetical protein
MRTILAKRTRAAFSECIVTCRTNPRPRSPVYTILAKRTQAFPVHTVGKTNPGMQTGPAAIWRNQAHGK